MKDQHAGVRSNETGTCAALECKYEQCHKLHSITIDKAHTFETRPRLEVRKYASIQKFVQQLCSLVLVYTELVRSYGPCILQFSFM